MGANYSEAHRETSCRGSLCVRGGDAKLACFGSFYGSTPTACVDIFCHESFLLSLPCPLCEPVCPLRLIFSHRLLVASPPHTHPFIAPLDLPLLFLSRSTRGGGGIPVRPHHLTTPAIPPDLSVVGVEPVKAMREQFETALPGVQVIEGGSVRATSGFLPVSLTSLIPCS